LDVIIETPRGSGEKYKYDEKYRLFRLHKSLPLGLAFPFDFGFIPGTKGDDNDPLDVMAISELQSFPGCIINCRIIGCIQAEQSTIGKPIRNDRYLAIPEPSIEFEQVHSLEGIPGELISKIEIFLTTYSRLEGKEFRLLGNLNAAETIAKLKSLRMPVQKYA
jgi:inorganic pyrophosphatase